MSDDLERTMRIVAKHLIACADELAGETAEPEQEPTLEERLAAAKAAQAERHKKLRQHP